jgi:hypothetical protein
MSIETIAATLRKHNGTWDSWGWTCRGCDAGQEFAPVSDAGARFGDQARAGLLTHQAEAIANA